ncbi:MAG: GNAT family N-acetyltransferase [Methanocorpusculum sp.]|nr:GNAT family N-acetyltransferase [Methanocorpusculum sp.]
MTDFITLTKENIESEHLCCAISDKKHQCGVDFKREWLKDRISEGHVFRKLDAKGKVFIEYASLEKAWVSVDGENYFYIYCMWVSGSFKDKGYGKELLQSCIADAKSQKKSGICVISSKKKKPFLSDKKFMEKYGFTVVDEISDYELLALSFDGSLPHFSESAKRMETTDNGLTIYYSAQCPFVKNCIKEISEFCSSNNISLNLIYVDTPKKAKSVPCVFNNWAVFYDGKFVTHQFLNENMLKKVLKL